MGEKYTLQIQVNAFQCLRCQHKWIPRASMEELTTTIKKKPRICPNCKSAYWDLKRKNSKEASK